MAKTMMAVMVSALLLSGCSLFVTSKEPPSAAYYKELDRWHRKAMLYHGVEVTMQLDVVYKGADFRRAYMTEYIRRLGIEQPRAAHLMERELSKTEQYTELILVAATPVDEWNDLDSPNSIWRLYLVDEDGEKVEPVKIERLEKSAYIREFFPFVDEWSVVYRVVFPRLTPRGHTIGEGSEYIRLDVAGIKGSSSVMWNLNEQ